MAHADVFLRQRADVLYISFAPGEKPTAAVELNDNILLRFNLTRVCSWPDTDGFLGIDTNDAVGASQFPVEWPERP